MKIYVYFGRKSAFIRTRYRQNPHLWRHYGDIMSPENCGVFQLQKEVTFRGIMAFCNSQKWGCWGASLRGSVRFWLAGGTGPEYLCSVQVILWLRACGGGRLFFAASVLTEKAL